MDIQKDIIGLERDIKTMEGLLSEYKKRYKKCLQDIIGSYGLDGKVSIDAALLYAKMNDGTPYEYFSRGNYTGELIVLPTPDWHRPYSITFRTKETDCDGRAIYSHAFAEMTTHEIDPLELFKEFVLPYVKKV